MGTRPDRSVLLAFLLSILFIGANAVAVRFTVAELPPFWGAFLRFGAAALIFWALAGARRIPIPKGRALAGVLLYGFLNFGASYAFLYWGIRQIPAGLTQVVLALVPLLTFFAAVLHRLEVFRWRGLAGATLAVGGIALAFFDSPSGGIPVTALLAIVCGAVCIAESSVVVKIFPRTNPFMANAVGMSTGAAFLLLISWLAGEKWNLPARAATWASILYLVVVGSVIAFYLFLYVLAHWTASATSYQFVLFPFVTVLIAAWLAGERANPALLWGGALVLGGVWIGAFSGKSGPRAEAETGRMIQPAAQPGGGGK